MTDYKQDEPKRKTDTKDCSPNHTPCPSDYFSWQEWAKKKFATHRQIKCDVCGLYAVWIPKE